MRQGKRSHTPEEREGEYHPNTLYRHKPLRLLLNQRLDGPGITEAGAADSHEKQDYTRYRHNNALNHDCCCYTLNAACHSCNDNQYGEDCQTDTVILTGQNLEDSSAARNSRNRKCSQKEEYDKAAQKANQLIFIITVHQQFHKGLGICSAGYNAYTFAD